MRHNGILIRCLLAVVFFVILQSVTAQSLRTGYFMDGNMFRYRMNPAYMSERGHFSIPILGGVGLTTESNLGFGDLFYDSHLNNGEYLFFMHNSVDTKDFLARLEQSNDFHFNADFTLLSAGFKAYGGYTTIDVTMHSRVSMNMPYDLFRFMKVANPMLDAFANGRIPAEEMGASSFDIGGVMMNTRNYIDLSLGHSRTVNKNLTLGARAKVLWGLGYANAEIDQMNIKYDNIDSWSIQAHGSANVALGGEFKSQQRLINGVNNEVVNGYRGAELGIQGIGFGVDLGAIYEFKGNVLDGLTLSASVNDLGFIRWKDAKSAEIAGGEYSFGGFNRMGIIMGTESIDDQIDNLTDDLGDFIAMHEKEDENTTTGIGAKLNIGAEYAMPFYKKLSVGALYTHCFDDIYSYDQTSLVLTVSPLKVFDLALSSTFSDYGTRFGAMANLHFTGISLFVGTDCFMSDLSDSDYPLPNENMNANITLGVNISFSKFKK